MIDLAPTFLRESLPGLVSEAPAAGGLRGWLQQETFGVSLSASGNEVVLNGIVAENFFPYLLSDYSRFAMAAHESIHLSFADPFDRRATAWSLINRYYSAFFSAHALLRVHGRGVTWIDGAEAARLEKLGKLYIGTNFQFGKGGYAFEFGLSNSFNAELRLARLNSGSGSHDDFWRYFSTYLVNLGAGLLKSGAIDAQQAVARFDEIRQIILAPSMKGAWLSFMRNEINYQHKFGTWFPFKLPAPNASLEKRLLQQSNSAVNLAVRADSQPLKAFNAVTCCLASLNGDLASILKGRAGVGASRFRSDWDRLSTTLAA